MKTLLVRSAPLAFTSLLLTACSGGGDSGSPTGLTDIQRALGLTQNWPHADEVETLAGFLMVVLRRMRVGEFVSVAGVTGTVAELGLFTTTINTPDNVQTILGNNKVFSDTIQNFTVNPFRRVDLKCQLSGAADHKAAMALLREKIAMIPNVLPEPKVDVEILDFTLVGPVLAVRPYCHNDNYWQVYFDTNKVLREALAEAGFRAPMPAQSVIVTQAA